MYNLVIDDQQLVTNVSHWLNTTALPALAVILAAILLRIFGGRALAQILRRVVQNNPFNPLSPEDIKKRQDTLLGLFDVVFKVLVISIAGLVLVGILFPHVNLAPVFASAGILGVAIGFGAQSLIKDFLTGVFIILENQYRVGDVVDIDGAAGTVERINIRSTVIRDADGNVHYLPNGTVVHVINKTMGFSKVRFTVTVKPDTDIANLTEVINKVGARLAKDVEWKDRVIEAPVFTAIGTFTDSALEATIVGTTKPSEQWSVTGEMRSRLLAAFRRHKIELAHLPVTGSSTKK